MTDPATPSFAREYPETPEIAALVVAFARGDYALVRANAPRLAASTADPRVKQAALELFERTRPDPLAVALLALTAALVMALGGWWMAYGKAPPQPPAVVVPR